MSMGDSSELTSRTVFSLRIIVCALCFGVASFGVVTFFMRGEALPPPAEAARGGGSLNPIVVVAGAFTAISLVVGFLLPGILDRAARRRLVDGTWKSAPSGGRGVLPPSTEEEFLRRAFTTRMIVVGALTEGAAFFTLIAVLITRTTWVYALTTVLTARLVMLIPAVGLAGDWIETQRSLAKEEGALGI